MNIYGITEKNDICGVNTETHESKVVSSVCIKETDQIKKIIKILNDNDVSLFHLNDVIEDFFI